MNQPPPTRDRMTRIAETLTHFEQDVDAWISTADARSGAPYLVPLSFLWDGASFIISTPAHSPTARNLVNNGLVRIGLGTTRDVVLIEGVAQPLSAQEISTELGDAFAVKTGFDPRELADPYQYVRLTPRRIQTWREENELKGRTVMRDGHWLED